MIWLKDEVNSRSADLALLRQLVSKFLVEGRLKSSRRAKRAGAGRFSASPIPVRRETLDEVLVHWLHVARYHSAAEARRDVCGVHVTKVMLLRAFT